MKHLLLYEQGSAPSKFITDHEKFKASLVSKDCDFSEIERFACEERFDGGVIVAINSWQNQRIEVLRGKFPNRKIILVCAMISDDVVKDLQNSKKSIDLFFKAPTSFDQITTMFEAMTSAQTATVQVDFNEDDGGLEIENSSRDESEDEVEADDGGDLVLEGDDEETGAQEQTASTIDLAKELKGIDGDILGINNPKAENEDSGLMNLLQGEGEEDDNYDSHDISRILKSDVLLEELNKSKSEDSNDDNQEKLNEHFASEGTKTILSDDEDDDDDGIELESAGVVIDDGDSVYEVKPKGNKPPPKPAAPEPTPAPPPMAEQETVVTKTEASPVQEVTRTQPQTPAASSEDVERLVRHREDDYLKLLSRNEILEEENRILREKVISLEEVASSASIISKKKSLESDEHKIRVSVLKRRHREELERAHKQVSLQEEKMRFLEEKTHKLEADLKNANKQNLIDVKKVRSREEELQEKLDLMKADISMQIRNRENKIIELKRKIDLLQFDLKDSEEREKELSQKITNLEEKLYQLKKVLGESIDKLEVISEIPLAKVKL